MMESTPWVKPDSEMMSDFVDQIRNALKIVESKKVGEQSHYYNDNDDQEKEPLVIDVEKLQADIIKNFKENKNPNISKRWTKIAYPHTTNLSSYGENNQTASNGSVTPLLILQKVKKSSPNTEIADAFFELCMVAACKNRDFLMQYIKGNMTDQPFYHQLSAYLKKYYVSVTNTDLKFNHMNLIGHLLLCYVPNYYSHLYQRIVESWVPKIYLTQI